MDMVDIGKTLKTLRLEEHPSQARLAAILHVSPSTVSHWESGKTIPKIAKIAYICRIFGMSLSDYFREFPDG